MYRANWSWQFKAIDDELDRINRSSQKHDHGESESKTRNENFSSKLPVEKRQSSPMSFGSTDALISHESVATNGISGACSSGNICAIEKASGLTLKKSHSTGYNKMQTNVMGKIKDRTGVAV